MTNRAIVLARGLGRRMQEADDGAALSREQRQAADAGMKAMMPVGGRPFLDFILGALADAGLTRVALIVAPEHEALRRHYLDAHPPARVELELVVQEAPRGTADAVLAAESWTAGEPFLTLNGDNLYPAELLARMAALDEPGLPVFARSDLVSTSNIVDARVQSFALVELDGDGFLARIVEKPRAEQLDRAGPDALVSMNCWRFDSRIFGPCREVPLSTRGEMELPEAVALALTRAIRFKAIPARGLVLDLSRRADAADLDRRLAGTDPRP